MTPMRTRRSMLVASAGLIGAACMRLGHAQQASAAASAERWIVTNSYVAEIVVALGGAARIVAIGGGAQHLAELKGVPVLPGFRQTSAEPMLSVSPTRVVITSDWAMPQTLAQLRAAGVKVDVLDAAPTVAGAEVRIRAIARLMDVPAAGEALVARFRSELAQARARVARASRKPRALFILAGGGRPTLVGGRNSQAAMLIELAGGVNVADSVEGFKVMSQEAMIEAAPEFILTNQEGLTPADGLPVALKAPGALYTPAGRAGRLITVPGHYLQGMGLFTPQGMLVLARQFHPDLG